MTTDIATLALSRLATNVLRAKGVNTVERLTAMTSADLWAINGLGRRSIENIKLRLHDRGMHLRRREAA